MTGDAGAAEAERRGALGARTAFGGIAGARAAAGARRAGARQGGARAAVAACGGHQRERAP